MSKSLPWHDDPRGLTARIERDEAGPGPGEAAAMAMSQLAQAGGGAASISVLSFAVQVLLTFASNVFVDPATLPGWLRAFVNANPVSHLVTAERALMNGTATAGQAGWVLLASAALVAVFGPVTMLLYRSRR